MALPFTLLVIAALVGPLEYRHRTSGRNPLGWRPGQDSRSDRDAQRLPNELAARSHPSLAHTLHILAAAQTAIPMHSAPLTIPTGDKPCSAV